MATDPKRVKEIFLEAAELPDEAAREVYLDQACEGDAGLRARVEALLHSHDPDGSFLGTPAAVVPDPDHAATRSFTPESRHPASQSSNGTPLPDDEVPLGFLDPPTRSDSLGRIGHYEVLQVLGQGGFGIVFRAFDEVLQRVVAVKVLAPQLAATSPARKRFLREARTSAAVRHENVVQVHEVGEQPLPYLVMEFIPGETLQQRLNRTGPLDALEVVRIGRQIAEGLAAAHATDLIHRDIKPGNILIEGGTQRVKITDFGLARAADDASISQSGIIAGTPMYMAPEQAKGEKLDQRADLFSLGSVLYQMASGRPPFRANSTIAVLKRVAEDAPRDIREIIPETPQWLCNIIAKLHAKNPDDRYQSAREVADVLEDCEEQLKTNSKLKDFCRIPKGIPKPARRMSVLRVAVAIGIPVVLFALLTIAVYLGTRSNLLWDDERWVKVAGGQDVSGWGRVSDPMGDSLIQTTASRVRITVPTNHNLNAFNKQFNAPSITQEVKGDFRARVRVLPFKDVGENPSSQAQPYIAGSLILWGVGTNFARVDRVRQHEPDMGGRNLRHDVVAFHTSKQPLVPVGLDLRRIEPEGPSYLELERRGDTVTARTSIDGVNWSAPYLLPPLDLPDTVQVGVAAICMNSLSPLSVEFEGFEVLPIPASPSADGFVQLFNGKDLKGWKIHRSRPGKWTVENGILVGREKPGYLFTQRGDYKDFHLRAEVKLSNTGNGGLGFRNEFGFDIDRRHIDWNSSSPIGYTVELAAKEEVGTPVPAGSLHRIPRSKDIKLRTTVLPKSDEVKAEQWFTLEVIARGDRFTIMIDGKTMVDFFDPFPINRPGHLSLQVLAPETVVQFRKIEIKVLPPEDPDFVPLFNGKDLTGWKTHPDQPGDWSVENGALVGRGRVSHLFSDRGDYSDFELRVEARISVPGDSGIFFRSEYGLSRLRNNSRLREPDGYEAQICYTVHPAWKTGSLIGPDEKVALNAILTNVIRPNEWFTMDIVARDNKIIVRVNGQTVVDHTDTARHFVRGHIALQVNQAETIVEFRKIEIKELPPIAPIPETKEIPPNPPVPETVGEFVPLFNGKDLTGWEPGKEDGVEWTVEDGAIVGENAPGYLFTTKFYENFHVKLEAKLSAGGNGGFSFRGGYQAEMRNDPLCATGSIICVGPTKTEVVARYPRPAVPADQWFTLEIRAVGQSLSTRVNDGPWVTAVDDRPERDRSAPLSLETGTDTTVRFRKIEIKELPAK